MHKIFIAIIVVELILVSIHLQLTSFNILFDDLNLKTYALPDVSIFQQHNSQARFLSTRRHRQADARYTVEAREEPP